jgi:hypothetical protein
MMARKMLLLTMLSCFLAMGGIWALRAQDPTTPQTPTAQTQPQTTATNQVDLSGTYAGTFDCEAAGLMGDTTITINGNEFTTESGKKGRIIASKNPGYTAVAIQVSPADPNAKAVIVSLRGKKSGNKLTLKAAPGEATKCTFSPARNVARGRRTPAATGTEVSNPSAVPAQTPSPTPTPEPSPEASPSPSGSPRPRPTASPSPGEPTPTPSPSPSPSPRH